MRKILTGLVAFVAMIIPFAGSAENRWSIYGGGSISHLCRQGRVFKGISNDGIFQWTKIGKYGWGGGAFIGAAYDIRFNRHWSISPQLELSFINNGATNSDESLNGLDKHWDWMEIWSLDIPIMVNYRFRISENTDFRLGAGCILQNTLSVTCYNMFGNKETTSQGSFEERTNIAAGMELAVEPGRHFSYFFRGNYPPLRYRWNTRTLTLSLGLRYTF